MIAFLIAAIAEPIPDLRPPLEPLTPGFWEQSATWWGLVGVLFIVADVAIWIWWANRKARPVELPIAERARETLRALQSAPESAELAANVSREVRHYATATVGRAGEELTTEELTRAVAADRRFDAAQLRELSELLRDCDRKKFASAQLPAPKLAERALELVESFEQRLQPPPEDA